MHTTTAAKAPRLQTIAYGGTPKGPIDPTHAILRKEADNLYQIVTVNKVSIEYHGKDQIVVGDVSEAKDAVFCKVHPQEAKWFSPTHAAGLECKSCLKARTKELREARKQGIELSRKDPNGAAAKERLQRVVEANRLREVSRERMVANLLRSQAHAGQHVKGSRQRREDYTRCLLTATCATYRLTVEQAATLAEMPAWEPMTWAEFRATYPTKAADDEAAA